MQLFNRTICNPAVFYFTIAILGTIVMLIQNRGKPTHCVGNVNCKVPNTYLTTTVNLLMIIFWTFVVNVICSYGFVKTAWVLVLLPFIFLALALGALLISGSSKTNSL